MDDNFETVASVGEVAPGAALLVTYGRTEVILVNVDGAYYAFEDRCSHADVALSDGTLDLDACTVTCPKHGSRFDIRTGKALNPPAYTPVHTYAVRVDGDAVRIGRVARGRA